ncbi:hypothetical protein EDD22DRAFT_871065 [Suillus occidentalis]|nr:hypothetical protein EDD22DRAFT_871065 [Suillus occidentalis]
MCLSTHAFDYAAVRCTTISQLSNALGSELLDAYIALTANRKLHTELYVLAQVLKGRVYPNDLWGLIGERIIEAKQEETLHMHLSTCTHGDPKKHAAVERVLLEERKRRCVLEVTLYSQAIEFFEQHWLSGLSAQARHTFELIKPPLKQGQGYAKVHAHAGCAPLPYTPLACAIETREPESADVPLIKITVPSLLNSPMPSVDSHASQGEIPTSNNSNHTNPNTPLRLTSTWVPPSVLETFTEAFEKEIAIQAEPMALSLATRRSGSNALLRNLGLELLVLYAKRGRAEAEGEVYGVAIGNCCGFDGGPTSMEMDWKPLGEGVDVYCVDEEYGYDGDIEIDVENGSTEGSCGDYEDYDM